MTERGVYDAGHQPPPPDPSTVQGLAPPPPSSGDEVVASSDISNAELGTAVAASAVGWGASWLIGWLMFGLAFVLAIAAFFVIGNATQDFGLAGAGFFAVFAVYYLRGTLTALQSSSADLSDKLGSARNIVLGSIATVLALVCLFAF